MIYLCSLISNSNSRHPLLLGAMEETQKEALLGKEMNSSFSQVEAYPGIKGGSMIQISKLRGLEIALDKRFIVNGLTRI